MSLSPKQRRFVAEYLKDQNAKQAAIRAGYSKRSAEQDGPRLLRNAEVEAAINDGLKLVEEKALVTVAEVINEYRRVAFCDVAGAFNPDGSIKPIHEIPEDVRRAMAGIEVVEDAIGTAEIGGKEGVKFIPRFTKKVKFWEKTKALEGLGRFLKMFTDKLVIENLDELGDKLMAARGRVSK